MRGLPLGLFFNWYTFWFWFPSFFCGYFGGLSMFGLPRVLGSFGWLIILGLPRGLRSFGGLSICGLPRDLLYCSRGLPLFFGFSFGCSIVISVFIYLTLYIYCYIFFLPHLEILDTSTSYIFLVLLFANCSLVNFLLSHPPLSHPPCQYWYRYSR